MENKKKGFNLWSLAKKEVALRSVKYVKRKIIKLNIKP